MIASNTVLLPHFLPSRQIEASTLAPELCQQPASVAIMAEIGTNNQRHAFFHGLGYGQENGERCHGYLPSAVQYTTIAHAVTESILPLFPLPHHYQYLRNRRSALQYGMLKTRGTKNYGITSKHLMPQKLKNGNVPVPHSTSCRKHYSGTSTWSQQYASYKVLLCS